MRVYRNHKNYSEADLMEVLEPSPDRVTPACPVRFNNACVRAGQYARKLCEVKLAPTRLTPTCMTVCVSIFKTAQLFGTCGGCQYQHMAVPAQREWKRKHVEEVLARTGNITDVTVNPVFGTDEVLGYRSKITPHHEKPRSVSQFARVKHARTTTHITYHVT